MEKYQSTCVNKKDSDQTSTGTIMLNSAGNEICPVHYNQWHFNIYEQEINKAF